MNKTLISEQEVKRKFDDCFFPMDSVVQIFQYASVSDQHSFPFYDLSIHICSPFLRFHKKNWPRDSIYKILRKFKEKRPVKQESSKKVKTSDEKDEEDNEEFKKPKQGLAEKPSGNLRMKNQKQKKKNSREEKSRKSPERRRINRKERERRSWK